MATMIRRLFGIKSSIEKKMEEQKWCENCTSIEDLNEEYNGMIGDEQWEAWIERSWIAKIQMMEATYGIMCNNHEEWDSGNLLLKKQYDEAAMFMIDYIETKFDFIDDFKINGLYDRFPRCLVVIRDEAKFVVRIKSLTNYIIEVYKDNVAQEFNNLRDACEYIDEFY